MLKELLGLVSVSLMTRSGRYCGLVQTSHVSEEGGQKPRQSKKINEHEIILRFDNFAFMETRLYFFTSYKPTQILVSFGTTRLLTE